MLPASSLRPAAPRLTASYLVGGVAVVAAALGLASALPAAPAENPCAVAFDPAALSPRDRGLVARQLLACSDVVHGRITPAAYQQQLASLDQAWAKRPAPPPPPIAWASSVREVSTQYSATSWSAQRVLGAPDVFPAGGDNANAWASLGADDRDEWIEVGYAQPMQASAVEVYETFNPGAVSEIELVTTSGKRVVAYQGTPAASGALSHRLRAEVGCTAEPIVAVKVHLASTQVPGWNELDAIGLVPCAEQ